MPLMKVSIIVDNMNICKLLYKLQMQDDVNYYGLLVMCNLIYGVGVVLWMSFAVSHTNLVMVLTTASVNQSHTTQYKQQSARKKNFTWCDR